MVAILKQGMKIIKKIIDTLNVCMWGRKGAKVSDTESSDECTRLYFTAHAEHSGFVTVHIGQQ